METLYEDAELFFDKLFMGKHHIPGKIKPYGEGWTVSHYGDMSTYDFDMLTRLVFLSHDMCMRSSVMQSGPRMVKIAVWKRIREGSMSQRHPTIEEALTRWRNSFPDGWMD